MGPGVFLVFSLVILQVTQLCQSQLIVNTEVSGYYVVKTGIRTYTVSSRYTYNSYVIISCSSRSAFPSTFSLWKDNEQINEEIVMSANGVTFGKYYKRNTVNQVVGEYQCVLKISTWISNDSYSEFIVRSTVEVRIEPHLPVCASSIGDSGYVGERAVFKCTRFSSYSDEQYKWEGLSTNILLQVFDESLSENSFTCKYNDRSACSLSTFSVFPSLNLNISQRTTINDTTLHNPVMEFFCNSTPPRLMYWKVFGAHGNLLDVDNLNQFLNVNITVSITQSLGQTTLSIWEAVAGFNGIHTVMCITYDTDLRVVATLNIPRQPQPETDLGCECDSLTPTFGRVNAFDNPSTPLEDSTLVISSTVTRHLQHFEVDPTERGDGMKAACSHDYFLMGAVVLPLLITILVLVGILFYMYYRNRRETGKNTDISAQYVPPSTELHDNPTYLVFTVNNDSTHGNESEDRDCTYYNL